MQQSLQYRNQIIDALENDRRYSIQKRKLVEFRNPTTETKMNKIPTAQKIRHKSNNIDFHSILDIKLKTPSHRNPP
jgi:hypothetical protein